MHVLSRRFLPTIAQLYDCLRTSQELLGEPGVVTLLTVAVSINNEWHNFATVARLEAAPGRPSPAARIDFDAVTLLSATARPANWREPEDLERFLSGWRQVLGMPHGHHFQLRSEPERLFRLNPWQEAPGWRVDLLENVAAQRGGLAAPRGTFINVEYRVYADTIGELAQWWLRHADIRQETGIRHQYVFLFEDRRGTIAGLTADGNALTIAVEALDPGSLFAAVTSTDFRRREFREMQPVADGAVRFDFPGAVRTLDVSLATRDGELLDRYSENERSSSWGRTLYNEPRTTHDPAFADLQTALSSGESLHIEFKPFIRAVRGDEKALEIPQTVAAFANTGGGVLFMGVSDNLEPVGVLRDLRKEYQAAARGDVGGMQDSYVRDIRKLLGDVLGVSVAVEFTWIEFGADVILGIQVPEVAAKPVAFALNGDVYVRTGANSRTLRQADIPRFFG